MTGAVSTVIEDYLKHLWHLQQRLGAERVSLGTLGEQLGVAPGTVTAMMKRLARMELVDYEPYAGASLTGSGERKAISMIRRHRLIETFLVQVLGFDWSQVDDEAERLEHACSDRLLDALDAYLDYPTTDPHGDPIPNAAGELPLSSTRTLAGVESATAVRIARIMDQSGEFLTYCHDHGLRPGADITVEKRDDVAQLIHCRAGEAQIPIAFTVARRIRVE